MTPDSGVSPRAEKMGQRCYICGESKSIEAFPRDRTKASGRMSRCRVCDSVKSAERVRRLNASHGNGICAVCGRVKPSRRHRYCVQCGTKAAKHYGNRTKRRSTSRGYGSHHQKLRKQWELRVNSGTVRCARGAECLFAVGGVAPFIAPGEAWDLGHDDVDRSVYRGPEHARCNRSYAAVKGNRERDRVSVASRVW